MTNRMSNHYVYDATTTKQPVMVARVGGHKSLYVIGTRPSEQSCLHTREIEAGGAGCEDRE